MKSRFLVATHAGLHEVCISESYELERCVRINEGHHYGITVQHDSGKVFTKNRDEFLDVREIDGLSVLSRLEFKSEPGHVHQVLCKEGKLFLTDTINNRVSVQDEHGECHHFQIDGRKEDINHVNSLFFLGNELVCLLHNRRKQPSELLYLTDFEGEMSMTRRRPLKGFGCHNIYIEEGRAYFSDSAGGLFICMDLGSGAVLRAHRFDGHTKGLSVTEEAMMIGVSDHAVREDRPLARSSMVFFDSKGDSKLATVQLFIEDGKPIGNINEIRTLSSFDFSEGGRRRNTPS